MPVTLEQLITRLEALPGAITREAAPELAVAVRESLMLTVNAGQTPDGVTWAPRKEGSGPVLANAAAAVRVGAIGSRIYVRLIGIEARHHRGRVKGGTMRQIIPRDQIPQPMADAMRAVLTRRFHAVMSGGNANA